MIYKRSTALERSVENVFTGGLKLVSQYQLTLSFDVDQDIKVTVIAWATWR